MAELKHTANAYGESVVIREFFAADVESIESVGAVDAVFEQVFLLLGELFDDAGTADAEA